MIKLNRKDINYLLSALDLNESQRQALLTAQKGSGIIDDDTADDLGELCADRLEIFGFKSDDEPTPEGHVLEDMIDKLFVD